MRTAGASLSTYFDTHTATPPIRHLITVTPKTGSIVRWTDHHQDLLVSGNTFLAGGEGTTNPLPKVGRSRRTHGTENIDKLALKLLCADQALFNGVRLPLFAAQRGLDGAVVKVERLYIPDTGALTSLGAMWWFEGPVGAVKPTSVAVELEIESGIAFLAATMLPRIVFQPGCVHQLYDAECALAVADNTFACTVAASPTPTTSVFATSTTLPAPTQVSDFFRLGVVTFTSGALNGTQRAVRIDSYSAGVHTLTMDRPLPAAPAASDGFNVFPGCDKQQATCSGGKFRTGPSTFGSNLVHFRGFPYVPRNEAAL